MPKRTDIKSILIIGAGPIVIGQACEFDYSGTQAVKTLMAEGYRVILVNSNPATIMTDPEIADATYIEPITPEYVEKIIARERPDALLPTMGGQTALNCAKALAESGVLKKYNVELIGANLEAINKAEDRHLFNEAMKKIGLSCPKNAIAHTIEEARAALEHIGLPAVIRPSFTMGGTGGGIAYNREEFEAIVISGLDASPTTEVLIDESVLGWKEYEMEVVRDKADNCIIVCSIENIDPMGVHTGDSITVAPALTLTDKEYQIMRNASIAVLREIGVDTGGSNVQFAVNPADGRMVVIEMNPRVSRSSALASKATGFPIAKVAAKLAVGYTLDEIANDVVSGQSSESRVQSPEASPNSELRTPNSFLPASFEPTIDYIVTKVPRFAFEKFPGADTNLTTAMKSVGESMAMGRSFPESLQKALRSLETGLTGLNPVEIDGASPENLDPLRSALAKPTPDRLLVIAQALRLGMEEAEIHRITHYDPWFIAQLKRITDAEQWLKTNGLPEDAHSMRAVKALGFSDRQLAQLTHMVEEQVRAHRHGLGVRPVYKRVDSCAGEFASSTAYMYSTYEQSSEFGVRSSGEDSMSERAYSAVSTRQNADVETNNRPSSPNSELRTPNSGCEAAPSTAEKIVILGGGPNRIGQGIEFDYCCVHACYALKSSEFRVQSSGEDSMSERAYSAVSTRQNADVETNNRPSSPNSELRTPNSSFETIMINCNPETVSTDYDTADRLYFEPLTAEDVLEVLHVEQQAGSLKGVIVQFGGQTPLKLAHALEHAGIPIIGTSVDSIDLAEDRERFQQLLHRLGLKQPANAICKHADEAIAAAESIGFPVVVRPSYVLGGRAMRIIHNAPELSSYVRELLNHFGDGPILLDRYVSDAIELDVDCLSDGNHCFVAGIMEHIEEAGIHSGDSACALPPHSISAEIMAEVRAQTIAMAKALKVVGLMNVQFAVKQSSEFRVQSSENSPTELRTPNSELYVLEVNPRASRTAPFVAKATGIPIAKIAAKLMAGAKLKEFNLPDDATLMQSLKHTAVKEVVFPFARFSGVDTILGPEMKSTGEAMGLHDDFASAFAKGFVAAGSHLPKTGTVFISVKDADKIHAKHLAEKLIALGFSVIATRGTAFYLQGAGVNAAVVQKVSEGRPHIVDAMKNGEICMVFNTTEGTKAIADSASIRRTALLGKIPYSTTISGAYAMVEAIEALGKAKGGLSVKPLQDYQAA